MSYNSFRFLQAAEKMDEDIDWWSKYYASIGQLEKCKQYLEHGYDTLHLIDGELEKVEWCGGLTDFCSTFDLERGKELDDDDNSAVGEVKVSCPFLHILLHGSE